MKYGTDALLGHALQHSTFNQHFQSVTAMSSQFIIGQIIQLNDLQQINSNLFQQ